MAGELQNIFNSIYSAASQAQKAVEEQQAQRFISTYFEKDGSPKSVTIKLNDQEINAPLVTLVQHNPLKIDELEIDLEVNIDHDGDKSMGCLGKLRGGKQMANVKIKFTSTDQAEGLARVGDNLVKIIPTIS